MLHCRCTADEYQHRGNIQHIVEYTQNNRPVPYLSEDWQAVLHDEWTFVY